MARFDVAVTGVGGFISGLILPTRLQEGRTDWAVDAIPPPTLGRDLRCGRPVATYINSCVQDSAMLSRRVFDEPINIGGSELFRINEFLDTAEQITAICVDRKSNLDAPKEIRGCISDNTGINKELGPEPSTQLGEA